MHRLHVVLGALLGLGAAGAVALLVLGGGGDERPKVDLDRAASAANARFVSQPYERGINEHTGAPVRYPTNPPVNGPHAFAPAADGVYDPGNAPRPEQVVHALEHGRIAIQYRPGLPSPVVRQLERLHAESPEHVLLVENTTGMPCDVAVTAWSRGMLCPKFGPSVLDAVRAFRDRYRDRGPESLP